MNYAYVDGSVRFMKETIDTMPIDLDTGHPLGIDGDFYCYCLPWITKPGTQFGVFQESPRTTATR